jgi:8-amino-7-oxononanoate synthase
MRSPSSAATPTNVTTIGHLFAAQDLVVHDELIHNSVVQGISLSGARRLPFPHNDWEALDAILGQQRQHFQRVLIVLEGIYSMDGDYPELPRFVGHQEASYRAFLMVDEAHSFGVMGANRTRHQGALRAAQRRRRHLDGHPEQGPGRMRRLRRRRSGRWSNTSSSWRPAFSTASACRRRLPRLRWRRCSACKREPERVATAAGNAAAFLAQARAAGVDTGHSAGFAVIPAITGSSIKAARLAAALFERGINVQPILYPAVPEKSARLRFFISCEHSEAADSGRPFRPRRRTGACRNLHGTLVEHRKAPFPAATGCRGPRPSVATNAPASALPFRQMK